MVERQATAPEAPAAKAHAPAGRGRTVVKPAAARRRRTKRKPVRWSAGRERRFLERLGETANVADACRISGLSDTSVYRRRGTHETFRLAWAEALREGFVKLETMMLERALAGSERAVWHGGRQVGTVHEFDNRLAMTLLAAHRATVTAAAARAG